MGGIWEPLIVPYRFMLQEIALLPPWVLMTFSFIFMNFHFFQSTFITLLNGAALRMIFPLFASSQWHNPKSRELSIDKWTDDFSSQFIFLKLNSDFLKVLELQQTLQDSKPILSFFQYTGYFGRQYN